MLDEKTIKKALIDLELTQTEIARRIGVKPQAVHQVIKGRDRSKLIESALSQLVKKANQLRRAG